MATTSDIRNGLCIRYNNDIFKVIDFLHVKPGKGPAFVRTKLKSVTNGKVIDNTFPAGRKLDDVRVETQKFQFLYADGESYKFMNTTDYNQISLENAIKMFVSVHRKTEGTLGRIRHLFGPGNAYNQI